jgi:hypothetical protein
VAAGGVLLGTQLGTRRLQGDGICRALAAVLIMAGLKLIFT